MSFDQEFSVNGGSKPRRVWFASISQYFLIAFVFSALVWRLEFSPHEDISRYSDNLVELSAYTNIPEDRSLGGKGLFYMGLVSFLPLFGGSVDLLLQSLRGSISLLLFLAIAKPRFTSLRTALLATALFIIPLLNIQFLEYLRQGLALGLLLICRSVRSRVLQVCGAGLAVAMHPAVASLIVCWASAPYMLWLEKHFKILVPFSLFLTAIIGLTLITNVMPDLSFVSDALSGSRSNPLGAIALIAYALVLLIQHIHYRDRDSAAIFLLGLIVVMIYPVILDYGRFMSLLAVGHIACSAHRNSVALSSTVFFIGCLSVVLFIY